MANLVPEIVVAAEAWDKRGACSVELARTAAKARVVASLELIWRDERRRQCATGLPLEPTMPGGPHNVVCKCCFKVYVMC